MKKLDWVGNTRERLKRFPEEARREGGRQLRRVQYGLEPEDWKPMTSAGSGVIEIRLHQPHEYRVLYLANLHEAVYVIHAFEKKTQQTRQHELSIARRNYDCIKNQRKKVGKIKS